MNRVLFGFIILFLIFPLYIFAETEPEFKPLKIFGAGDINSTVFSPDDTMILAGGEALKLYDTETGEDIRAFVGHTGIITSVNFSHDGKRILSGSEDKTMRLWEAETGICLNVFRDHTNVVYCVRFSPDDSKIISASADGYVHLYDAYTGEKIKSFYGHSAGAHSVAFSPDGTKIITGSLDKTAKLWNIDSGLAIATCAGHTQGITSVNYTPDGSRIITGGSDNKIRIWNGDSGAFVREITGYYGYTGRDNSIAVSPDSTKILALSLDHPFLTHLYEINTGALVKSIGGHYSSTFSIDFSSNGEEFISSSLEGTIKMFDIKTGSILNTITTGLGSIYTAALSPLQIKIVFGGTENHTAKLLDISSGIVTSTFNIHNNLVITTAFHPDGNHIFTGSIDNTAAMTDINTGVIVHGYGSHSDSVYSIAVNSSGTKLLTGSADKTAKLWDVNTAAVMKTFSGHSSIVSSVDFSADENFVLTGSYDGTAKIWNANTGATVKTFQTSSSAGYVYARYFPDGQSIVTGGADGFLRFWNTSSGLETRNINTNYGAVTSLALSSDGEKILSAGYGSIVKLWDAETGEQLKSIYAGTRVKEVLFSKDNTVFLTCGFSGTIQIWPIDGYYPVVSESWSAKNDWQCWAGFSGEAPDTISKWNNGGLECNWTSSPLPAPGFFQWLQWNNSKTGINYRIPYYEDTLYIMKTIMSSDKSTNVPHIRMRVQSADNVYSAYCMYGADYSNANQRGACRENSSEFYTAWQPQGSQSDMFFAADMFSASAYTGTINIDQVVVYSVPLPEAESIEKSITDFSGWGKIGSNIVVSSGDIYFKNTESYGFAGAYITLDNEFTTGTLYGIKYTINKENNTGAPDQIRLRVADTYNGAYNSSFVFNDSTTLSGYITTNPVDLFHYHYAENVRCLNPAGDLSVFMDTIENGPNSNPLYLKKVEIEKLKLPPLFSIY